MKKLVVTAKAVTGLQNDLTNEEMLELTDSGTRRDLKDFLFRRIFVRSVPDAQVPEQFKWVLQGRCLATALDYKGPVAWRVQASFRLKQDGPRVGPCYEKWQYLQGWSLQNDQPTKEGLVFWVPRLLAASTGKDAAAQVKLLGEVRQQYALPAHHMTNFGSAALLAALVLAHFRDSGECVPLNNLWARTDTLDAGGGRLDLVWGEGSLSCGGWDGSGVRDDLGCFPLGWEALGA